MRFLEVKERLNAVIPLCEVRPSQQSGLLYKAWVAL